MAFFFPPQGFARELSIRSVFKSTKPEKVTETEVTLKGEIRGRFAYIEGVRVVASNPAGSKVTLNIEVRAVLDDLSEVTLAKKTLGEGTTFDDWLRWIYDVIGSGRTVVAVRIYAWCSAAPNEGYEPTVQMSVAGVQV